MGAHLRTFEDAKNAVMQHVADRHWDKNPPRGLAISISLEANELLEHYQWQGTPVGNRDELAGELADIFIYAIQYAEHYKIDIPTAILQKLEKSAKKYPKGKFTTTDPAIRKKAWIESKTNFKKDTIL